jgi:hypothetical protein
MAEEKKRMGKPADTRELPHDLLDLARTQTSED